MFSGKKIRTGFMQSEAPVSEEKIGGETYQESFKDGVKAYKDAKAAEAEEAYKQKHLQGGGVKGVKSYNAQSGAIYGILQQMHEDFETKLATARSDEAAA